MPGPILIRFIAVYNLVKIKQYKKYFTSGDITSFDICHSNISIRRPCKGEILFLKQRPFLALGHNQSHFFLFVSGSTQLLQAKRTKI